MKRISRKVRKEAIDLLLLLADVQRTDGYAWTHVTREEQTEASRVASSAWRSVLIPSRLGYASDDRLADEALEAAALLRDGWNPGDPVVRR